MRSESLECVFPVTTRERRMAFAQGPVGSGGAPPGVLRAGILCVTLLFGGCKLFAVGEVNQIVVAIPTELRETLGDDLRSALEPYDFTNRNERVLDVAYLDPDDPRWRRLRLMRHVLLVGTSDDLLVREALATSRRAFANDRGRVLQLEDVWARRQVVTIALLPDGAPPATVIGTLSAVGDLYRQQFDELVSARATLLGFNHVDGSLSRGPRTFGLRIPAPFEHDEPVPGMFRFRSVDPSEARPIIRTISVSSRAPDGVEWTVNGVRSWRAEVGLRVTEPPQVTAPAHDAVRGIHHGRRVLELRGAWSNPPGEWPAAGPFISRMIDCPDAVYLVDAWLYAPASDKYELLRQLETIVGTFRCIEAAQPSAGVLRQGEAETPVHSTGSDRAAGRSPMSPLPSPTRSYPMSPNILGSHKLSAGQNVISRSAATIPA